MYSTYYGLSHKPFELSPDPDLIFLSETHQEALSVLLYGVYNRKGFLQISGAVGTGKSTLVQALIKRLEDNVRICHIPNPNFTVEEFYYYIGAKFGLDEFDGNKAKFILNLAGFLKQCREKNEFALLIIDEAQVLSLQLLEEIRLLSNQEYTEFGVLSIFFVGQPELNVLLKHKKMDPLRNRIGIRFNLEPLTLDDTVAYIQFRLRKAGRTVLLFSAKAFEKIHEVSGGIPRSINILCDNALLAGFAEQRGVIDENIIIDCAKELGQQDEDSLNSESAAIDIKVQPKSTSPEPVHKEEATQNPQKSTPAVLRKKLFFAFVIICALFMAMLYTTEYWGRLPGTEPARVWFEKLHLEEKIFDKLKGLFRARKSEAQLSLAEKNMITEKVSASSVHQEEKDSGRKKPAPETMSIIEPAKESLPPDNILSEKIETKQNPGEINYGSTTSQAGPETIVTSLTGTDATVEQSKVRHNSDGINSVTIPKQAGEGPATKIIPQDEASTETTKTTQKSGEINYVSVILQVGGANIRSGPSMGHTILRSVVPGYPLSILDQQESWTLVEDFKERKGWVANGIIAENYSAILKTGSENLRSGPGLNYAIVAELEYGSVLYIDETRKNWLKVSNSDGLAGWIHKDAVWP